MVMKMNKSAFVKELSKQTGYDDEKCNMINSIIEDTFFIGKKNKEKIIEKFENQLSINQNEANELYDAVMSIIGSGIKDKLKHPFEN